MSRPAAATSGASRRERRQASTSKRNATAKAASWGRGDQQRNRRGRPVIHAGTPHVKRRRAQLETDPCHQEYRRQHERRPVGHLRGRDPVGDFVDVQSTVAPYSIDIPYSRNPDASAPSTKYFIAASPARGWSRCSATSAYKGQRLQLQPEVDHQQVCSPKSSSSRPAA